MSPIAQFLSAPNDQLRLVQASLEAQKAADPTDASVSKALVLTRDAMRAIEVRQYMRLEDMPRYVEYSAKSRSGLFNWLVIFVALIIILGWYWKDIWSALKFAVDFLLR